MDNPLLILKNVNKIYTEKTYIHRTWNTKVLKDINLTLEQGDFISILGKSLNGKSTLTGILSGRLPLSDGEMWMDGILVNELSRDERRNFFEKNVGVIYDSLALYKHDFKSTKELINQAIQRSKIIENIDLEKQIQKWLNYVEFANDPLIPFDQLPFNDRQKAAVAIAFAGKPKLIVADEPTNYLKADFILSLIEKYHREFNVTTIILTQLEGEAQRAQQLFMLRDGVLEKLKH